MVSKLSVVDEFNVPSSTFLIEFSSLNSDMHLVTFSTTRGTAIASAFFLLTLLLHNTSGQITPVCSDQLDVAFLIENTAYVGPDHFQTQLQFFHDLVPYLTVTFPAVSTRLIMVFN